MKRKLSKAAKLRIREAMLDLVETLVKSTCRKKIAECYDQQMPGLDFGDVIELKYVISVPMPVYRNTDKFSIGVLDSDGRSIAQKDVTLRTVKRPAIFKATK